MQVEARSRKSRKLEKGETDWVGYAVRNPTWLSPDTFKKTNIYCLKTNLRCACYGLIQSPSGVQLSKFVWWQHDHFLWGIVQNIISWQQATGRHLQRHLQIKKKNEATMQL